jgi:hypothetical protein
MGESKGLNRSGDSKLNLAKWSSLACLSVLLNLSYYPNKQRRWDHSTWVAPSLAAWLLYVCRRADYSKGNITGFAG